MGDKETDGGYYLPPDENGFRRWYEGDEYWRKYRREKRIMDSIVYGCFLFIVFGALLWGVLSVIILVLF